MERQCRNCGVMFDDTNPDAIRVTRYGTQRYYHSARCANEAGFVKCGNCGQWVYAGDTYNVRVDAHEERWCMNCTEHQTEQCVLCGAREPLEDVTRIGREGARAYVCSRCATHVGTCSRCGDAYYTERLHLSADGQLYCYDCLPENFGICAGCGQRQRIDNLHMSADGQRYCARCLPENRTYIRPYHHNPELRFDGRLNIEIYDLMKIYYGIELEMDDGDVKPCSRELYKLSNEDAIFFQEHDGSLSDRGIELITQPFSDPINSVPWEDIVRICKKNHFKSDIASNSCGLHIHFSRAPFGNKIELMEAKLVLFFSIHEEHIESIARRSSERWSSVKKVKLPKDEAECISELRKVKYSGSRYEAVNLTKQDTIEIRVFKGTLNLKTILATISFVKTVVEFCRNATVSEVRDTSFQDVLRSGNDDNLIRYAASRGIDMKEGN